MARKVCENCGQTKGSLNFALDITSEDGLSPACLHCSGSKDKNREGPERRRAAQQRYQPRRRKLQQQRYPQRYLATLISPPDEITYLAYSEMLDLHKIGHSKGLDTRLYNLRQRFSDLTLVTTYPFGRKLERFLGYNLATHQAGEGREWFNLNSHPYQSAEEIVAGLVKAFSLTFKQ